LMPFTFDLIVVHLSPHQSQTTQRRCSRYIQLFHHAAAPAAIRC
jgi:hypothetical protein